MTRGSRGCTAEDCLTRITSSAQGCPRNLNLLNCRQIDFRRVEKVCTASKSVSIKEAITRNKRYVRNRVPPRGNCKDLRLRGSKFSSFQTYIRNSRIRGKSAKQRKVKTKTNSSLHLFFLNLRKIFSENEMYIFELVTNILKLYKFSRNRGKKFAIIFPYVITRGCGFLRSSSL